MTQHDPRSVGLRELSVMAAPEAFPPFGVPTASGRLAPSTISHRRKVLVSWGRRVVELQCEATRSKLNPRLLDFRALSVVQPSVKVEMVLFVLASR